MGRGECSSRRRRTVLIVEDDRDLGETYRLWLSERDDIEPVLERRVHDVLDRVSGGVDALVLDRGLVDLSGSQLLDRLGTPRPPVVVVSAYRPDSHLSADDVEGYLVKPVTKRALLDAVDAALGDG